MLQPAQKGPIEGEANLTIFDGAGSGPSSSVEPWPHLPRERFSPLAQSGCRPHDCFEAGGAGDGILSPTGFEPRSAWRTGLGGPGSALPPAWLPHDA